MDIPITEFLKIPYINKNSLDKRVIHLNPFLREDGGWDDWLPIPDPKTGNQTLFEMKIEGLAQSFYYAKKKQEDADLFLNFSQLFIQRLNFPEISSYLYPIIDDISNLAASVEKIKLFEEIMKEENSETKYDKLKLTRFCSTELEYIFFVCRSLFDLLQKVILNLWKYLEFHNIKIKKDLPDSFSRMILNDNKPMSEQEIIKRYTLPKEFGAVYYSCSDIFNTIKTFRDSINHHGKDFSIVFCMDNFFAVDIKKPPFEKYAIWDKNEIMPNNLAPVLKGLYFFVINVISAFERFSLLISKGIPLPEETFPGYNVYYRSPSKFDFLTTNFPAMSNGSF